MWASPGSRVSRSRSDGHSPAGSAIRSVTVTITRRIGAAAGSAISRSRSRCSSSTPRASRQASYCRQVSARNAGLGQQPRRAAIVGMREFLGQELLEAGDGAPVPPQRVVERQHLGHQARTHRERRREAGGFGGHRPAAQDDFAIEGRQQVGRRRQTLAREQQEVAARGQARHGERRSIRGEELPFERAPQLVAGGAGRHQHHGIRAPRTAAPPRPARRWPGGSRPGSPRGGDAWLAA